MTYKVYVSVPGDYTKMPYILRIEAETPQEAKAQALLDFPTATVWVD